MSEATRIRDAFRVLKGVPLPPALEQLRTDFQRLDDVLAGSGRLKRTIERIRVAVRALRRHPRSRGWRRHVRRVKADQRMAR